MGEPADLAFHGETSYDVAMQKRQRVLAYARTLATDLQEGMTWTDNEYGAWWKATNPHDLHKMTARAAAALEFLRKYAGPDSLWIERAQAVYINKGENQSTESGVRALSDMLTQWADQVEADVIELVGEREWSEVSIVSTDVMEQVRRLLQDRDAHPAAAIVLCGAALETALRAVVEARSLTLTERPSLMAFARLLKTEKLISVQDVKDLEQCSGLRNLAAHGHFDDLSNERAGLMEQQTNLLLRRIADLNE